LYFPVSLLARTRALARRSHILRAFPARSPARSASPLWPVGGLRLLLSRNSPRASARTPFRPGQAPRAPAVSLARAAPGRRPRVDRTSRAPACRSLSPAPLGRSPCSPRPQSSTRRAPPHLPTRQTPSSRTPESLLVPDSNLSGSVAVRCRSSLGSMAPGSLCLSAIDSAPPASPSWLGHCLPLPSASTLAGGSAGAFTHTSVSNLGC